MMGQSTDPTMTDPMVVFDKETFRDGIMMLQQVDSTNTFPGNGLPELAVLANKVALLGMEGGGDRSFEVYEDEPSGITQSSRPPYTEYTLRHNPLLVSKGPFPNDGIGHLSSR